MIKKLGLFMMFFFLIGIVSSSEFDNVVRDVPVEKGSSYTLDKKVIEYNPIWEKYPPIKVEDNFGIGETLAEIVLEKHTDICRDGCSSEFEICTSTRSVLLDDLIFINMNTNQESTIKSFDTYISEKDKQVIIPQYEYPCTYSANWTATCNQVKIQDKISYERDYKKYNIGEEKEAGCYWIKIDGSIDKDIYDWRIKTQGKIISELAIWDGSSTTLNNSLVEFWRLNESTGANAPSAGVRGFKTLTSYSDGYSLISSGKIGGSMRNTLSSRGMMYTNLTNFDGLLSDWGPGLTYSVWVNTTNVTVDVYGRYILSDYDGFININQNANAFGASFASTNGTKNLNSTPYGSIINNTWYHLALTINLSAGGEMVFYINGVRVDNASWTIAVDRTSGGPSGNGFHVGGINGGLIRHFYGMIDEVGLWNRSLTAIEVMELYRIMNVTLNSPSDGQNFGTNPITFNCSATTTGVSLVNISLWSNSTGTWKQNQTTSVIGSSINSAWNVGGFTEGKSRWNCRACDSDNNCKFANSNYTLVFTTIGNFSQCTGTKIPFLNFTFKDLNTLAVINASISSLSTTYDTNLSFTFSDATEKPSFAFCYTPVNRQTNLSNLNIAFTSTGYVSNNIAYSTLSLTNISTNTTLYLSSLSDVTLYTMLVRNSVGQSLSNALVSVTRGGLTIGSGYTDSSGSIGFYLEVSSQYNVTLSKSGYETATYLVTILGDGSTFTLANTGTTSTNYNQGINVSIQQTNNILNNNTIYNFNMSMNSTYWTLTRFGFYITNGSGSPLLNTSSTAGYGGIVTGNLNTGLNKTFYLTYYWTTNGTTTSSLVIYTIWNPEDTQFSLLQLRNDFVSYLDSGMFGLTRGFGLNLVIFVFIFIVTGVIGYKFGMSDAITLSFIIFALTAFFDYGLNLIDYPSNMPVPYFATIFSAIIFFAFLIKNGVEING